MLKIFIFSFLCSLSFAQGPVILKKIQRGPSLSIGSTNTQRNSNTLAAIGASLILPGTGEVIMNENDQGKSFILTDLILIASYIGMSVTHSQLTESAAHYAAKHAEASGEDDFDFLQTISEYRSRNGIAGQSNPSQRDNYNLDRKRAGLESEYADTEQYYWNWGSTESNSNNKHFNEYNEMISWARVSKISSQVVLGTLIFNRLLSMANVWRISKTSKSRVRLIPIDNAKGAELQVDF
ncbi:hypothetical protein OAA91_02010 [Fibrobacterales bacterium]|nr:hypothetical protein [Fibrobacterales bacterium]